MNRKNKTHIPEINIVMLGMRRAGKTTYLAALHQMLKIAGNENHQKFFIRTTNEGDAKILEDHISELENGSGWPAGTQGQKNWKFECFNENRPLLPICRFNIVDYAGGLLSNPEYQASEAYQELDRDISKADVLIGLLDGVHVVNLFEGGTFSKLRSWWKRTELSIILRRMQRSSASIHFVITKWDYVKKFDNSISLLNVKRKLLEMDDFSKLVNNRKLKNAVRLIPVSSVGFDFVADFQASTFDNPRAFGVKMKIQEDVEISPENVDIPLIYALYDSIKVAYEKSKRESDKMGFLEALWNRVKAIFADEFSKFLPPGLQMFIKKGDAVYIIEKMEDRFRKRFNWKPWKQMELEKEEFKKLIDCFSARKIYFENEKAYRGNRFD